MPPAPAPCVLFDYSTYMVGATARTLTTDVMPIFTTSCAISLACHLSGSPNPPNLGGPADTPATVHAAIVGMTTTEVASMKYVVAGAPESSYLMRKVEDAVPGCNLTCTAPASSPMACSGAIGRMPQGGPYLDPDKQSVIRDWIKQGAIQ